MCTDSDQEFSARADTVPRRLRIRKVVGEGDVRIAGEVRFKRQRVRRQCEGDGEASENYSSQAKAKSVNRPWDLTSEQASGRGKLPRLRPQLHVSGSKNCTTIAFRVQDCCNGCC